MIPHQKNKIKKYHLLLLLMITALGLYAQSPPFISYQGAARNASGTPVASSSIGISFEIRQGSASSSPVFTETQMLLTNELGLFSTKIGTTNPTSFNAINWQAGSIYLQIGIDVNLQDGISYTDIGIQEVASVPYAMHAQSVPSSFTNNILSIGNATYALLTPQTLTAGSGIAINSGSIINTSPDQTVNLNPGTNIVITGAYPDYTITANPALTLNGDDLSISGGNTVTIAPTLSMNGNTLTVGPATNTLTLPTAATPSISGAGIATVSPASGYNFTVSVDQPTFAYSSATGSLTSGTSSAYITPTLGLTGNTLNVGPTTNTIALPAQITPSMTGVGLATVSPASGNNFTVSVAQPTFAYSNATGSLTSGTSSAYITPTLGLNGNTLNVGPATNSLALPVAATPTITNSGIAVVTPTSGYNFNVSVPSPTFTNIGQNIITGVYPNYSVNTPTIANTDIVLTATAAAGPSLTTSGTNSFALNIPPSAQGWNVTGNAGTNAGTNYIGTSDANNLSIKTNNQLAVTVNTLGYVGIGTSAPVAMLNVINTNSVSDGISVDNNNSLNGGNALQIRHFGIGNASYFEVNGSSSMGHAVIATSNSDVQHTIRSLNTSSLLTSYAGMFEGGLIGRGKNNANSFALVGKNFAGSDLFVVRNDGAIGIGTNAPAATLHINGTMRFVDGSQASGKVLTSDALGNATWSTPVAGWGLSGSAGTSTTTNYLGTSDATSFLIKTNASQRIIINSTGEVGFGSGYVPGAPVVMQGQAGNLGVLKLYNSNGTGGDHTFIGFNVSSGYDNFDIARIASERSGSGGEGRLLFYTGGFNTQVERVRIDEFGRVGIGTSAATATFQVNGTTRLVDGTQGLGKVLTSDASGNASWATPASGWNLTGNATTTAGTNFIGTTDAVGLRFKVNNVVSGVIEPGAPSNAFFGYSSGSAITTGSLNAGLGHTALSANNTGIMNAAVGYRALGANTGGNGNAAFGSDALLSNTTGIFNIGVGLNAGRNNTTGGQNVAVGKDALTSNSTGSGNIAIGYQAGFAALGSSNVFLGNSAGSAETGSNKLYIANAAGTPLIYGDFTNDMVGINTASPNAFLSVNAASVTTRNGVSIENSRDQVGGAMPLWIDLVTNGQTYGTNTHGRMIRLNNATTSFFYDMGINSNNGFFIAGNNVYSPAAVNISTVGYVGINTASPSTNLHVNGGMRYVDGTQGAGKFLTSDASGNASWATAPGWGTSGNAGTTAGTNYIGTSDNQDVVFKANATEIFRAQSGGIIRFPNNGDHSITAQAQSVNAGGNSIIIRGGDCGTGGAAVFGGAVVIQGGDGYNVSNGYGFGGSVIIRTGKNIYGSTSYNSGSIVFQYANSSNVITEAGRFDENGNLVITSGAYKPGGGSWTASSDARLKTNVHDYSEGLTELLKIHPVWYTYTGEAGLPKETYVGVIAQELQKVAPHMVKEWTYRETPQSTGKNYLAVDNGAMTYMMINAIKEQQKQIDELKKTVEEQNKQIDALLKK